MGQTHFDVNGETVVVAGGSKGLGRELALQLTAEGANVVIVARSPEPLEETRQELVKHVQNEEQTIRTAALDLTDAAQVETFINSLPTAPSILFCVAGGTADEIGFFVDITPKSIESCMSRNYLGAAYISQALLRRWVKEQPRGEPKAPAVKRHMVFTASTAAFVGLPGYVAYTPSKTATRALADTLRQEVLLYRTHQDIKIHCSFPGTIYTDTFYKEQQRKPALLKQLEGSEADEGGLSAARVAEITLQGLRQGKFFITMDSDTELLLNNMRGPSPRDSPIKDWLLGVVASFAWPFYRAKWDKATLQYGKNQERRSK
ncbi:steroid dehydrogenase [Penicillium chermesinum]|nr:steroid dehydrogenase [Penicillium chermesinum]